MVVVFLDLLGFSELLKLSTEVALDNINSFNYVIDTRIKDNLTHPLKEYTQTYPNDKHFQEYVKKSYATSFNYLISFSDSLIIGSHDVESFVNQLCNFVSTLYIDYSEPFREQFDDLFNVESNKIASYKNGILRMHKAFPILFRGGLAVGNDCVFFKEISIQDGKFVYGGYNVFGMTYLNAVKFENTDKGPRLFCDKSVVDSMKNKKIIRAINEQEDLFEIVWTIEACEATGCSNSNWWNNVLDRINIKLLPPAINYVKFYKSNLKYKDVLPHYEELLILICRGIVKYAEDKCRKGEESLKIINDILRKNHLCEYTFSELVNGFIEY